MESKPVKRQLTQQEQADMINNEMRNIHARVIGFNEALQQAWLGIKQALVKRGYPEHPFNAFWQEYHKKFTCTFTAEQIREFASDVNNKLSNGAKNARDAKRQRDCNRGSIHANGLFLEMLRILIDIFQCVRHSPQFPDREEVGKIVKFGLLAYACEKEYRNMNESGELTGITGRVFPKTALRLGFRQEIKKHWAELIVKSDSRQTTQKWQDRCAAKYQELVDAYQPNLPPDVDDDVDMDMMKGFTSSVSSSLPGTPQLTHDNSFDSLATSSFSQSTPPGFMSRSMTKSLSSSLTSSYASSFTSAGLPEELASIQISYADDIPDAYDVNSANPIPPSVDTQLLEKQFAATTKPQPSSNPSLPLPHDAKSIPPLNIAEVEAAAGNRMHNLLGQFHRMKEYFCKMQNQMDQNRQEWQKEVVGLRHQVSDLSSKVMELEIENQSLRMLSAQHASEQQHQQHQQESFVPRKRRRVDENASNCMGVMSADVNVAGLGGNGSTLLFAGNEYHDGYPPMGSNDSRPQQQYMYTPAQPQQLQQQFGSNVYDMQSNAALSARSELQTQTSYPMEFAPSGSVAQPGGASSAPNGASNQNDYSGWGYGASTFRDQAQQPAMGSMSFVDRM